MRLGTSQGRAVFGPWRAQVRAGLSRLPPAQVRVLRTLAPPAGDFAGFLARAEASRGIETEPATAPGRLLRSDRDAAPEALRPVAEALHAYHRTAVAPYWPRIRALVDAERALRSRTVLDGGHEALLTGLAPTVRWRPPVLEVDHPRERDLRPAGRGLVLIPSVFAWRLPVTLVDPVLPPVLVYPVPRAPGWWIVPDHTAGPRGLANLLGPTRAACLRLIEDGCTTGELARRLGMTAPTASQHARTLREAGLTTATRHANTVLHALTPLGADLLRAAPGPDSRRG